MLEILQGGVVVWASRKIVSNDREAVMPPMSSQAMIFSMVY
jgi:hypothetical protein